LLRILGAEGPLPVFPYPENFLHGSPEAALTVFDPVKWVVAALWRQLDSCATPFAVYKKRTVEVRERIVQETLFTLLLSCRFRPPIDKAKYSES
jgi:hypothetical protein